MKTVQEDPKEFFAEGGWDFLGGGGDVVSARGLVWIALTSRRTTESRNLKRNLHLKPTVKSSMMNRLKAVRIQMVSP
jgi:hypothetical protein